MTTAQRMSTDIRARAGIDPLVAAVRTAVASTSTDAQTASAVADALRAHLPPAEILSPIERAGDPDRYQQHILHVEPDGSFSVVALVWRPGQRTPIHDHLCWCVVGVIAGTERETRYEVVDEHHRTAVATDELVNEAGFVCGLAPPGDIHRVAAGDTRTISIHVYGANIAAAGSSIRRCYEVAAQPR